MVIMMVIMMMVMFSDDNDGGADYDQTRLDKEVVTDINAFY